METQDLARKDQCCGCGVCMSVCPTHAISMEEDAFGAQYPKIDQKLCIDCGKCRRVCAYKAPQTQTVRECFAAQNTDAAQLRRSTSGGVFPAIASGFLKQGCVCGAVMTFQDRRAWIRHALIEKQEELPLLQGSKYVQSQMWPCFGEMEARLKKGEKILFSGTPCQVDSVKRAFQKYVGSQLYTIDIICHGVPSQTFFNEYLQTLQKKQGAALTDFVFRDKRSGWTHRGKAVFDKDKALILSPENASYYKYFLDSEISRENCYSCPYASTERPGDLTIGDYWGIETFAPELLKANGGVFEKSAGISVILVNTEAGKYLLDNFGQNLCCRETLLEHIQVVNTQLREPARHSHTREKLLRCYQSGGYDKVEKHFCRQCRRQSLRHFVKRCIPTPVRNRLKKILSSRNV